MTNPLIDTPERDERIRTRAYHLWEQEGRPHGNGDDLWERARLLEQMHESAGAGLLANPGADGAPPPVTGAGGEPIEQAWTQDNLGEFPERLTDQGDRTHSPGATAGS